MDGTRALVCVRCCSTSETQPAASNQRMSTVSPGLDGVQGGDGDHEAVDVGERQRQQAADAPGRAGGERAGVAGGVEPGVGERDALAAPGRPARVEQGGEVVGRAVDDAELVAALELGPGAPHRRVAGPTTTTGSPPALARTFGRNSGVVTTATAPESLTTWRSSSSLSRNSTGVATAPARQSAA